MTKIALACQKSIFGIELGQNIHEAKQFFFTLMILVSPSIVKLSRKTFKCGGIHPPLHQLRYC